MKELSIPETTPPAFKIQVEGPQQSSFNDKKLNFQELPHEITSRLSESGINSPTPIQASSYHPIMEGLDILAQSMTGSGKTLAFALPIAIKLMQSPKKKNLNPTVLILSPTRELADQITKVFRESLRSAGCKVQTLIGGVSYVKQEQGLRSNVDIIVGTPGRVSDMIRKNKLSLMNLQTFVLDEVDQMLDIGFAKELNFIREQISSKAQTLFFSATMNREAKKMASQLLKDPVHISVESLKNSPKNIEHGLLKVKSSSKLDALVSSLVYFDPAQAIIFCETKKECADVTSTLGQKGFSCAQLNSDLNQYERQLAMNQFKHGKLRFLVATNVAARGIDVQELPLVINYTPPKDQESYTHRVGRTGRAGATGKAWTMVSPIEFHRFQRLLKGLNIQAKKISLPTTDQFLETIVANELNQYKLDLPEVSEVSEEMSIIENSLMKLSPEQIRSIVAQNLATQITKFGISDPSQFQFNDLPFALKNERSSKKPRRFGGRSSQNRGQKPLRSRHSQSNSRSWSKPSKFAKKAYKA